MTHVVLSVASMFNAWQEGVYSFIKEVTVKYKARRLAKETINQLQGLNDRELADLGLSRGMIRQLAEEHYQAEVNKNLKGWV